MALGFKIPLLPCWCSIRDIKLALVRTLFNIPLGGKFALFQITCVLYLTTDSRSPVCNSGILWDP